MLTEAKNTGQSFKAIYVAPTKVLLTIFHHRGSSDEYFQALCSERFRDWSSKFEPLGVKCESCVLPSRAVVEQFSGAELTGDTVIFGRGAWGEAKHASIM